MPVPQTDTSTHSGVSSPLHKSLPSSIGGLGGGDGGENGGGRLGGGGEADILAPRVQKKI